MLQATKNLNTSSQQKFAKEMKNKLRTNPRNVSVANF